MPSATSRAATTLLMICGARRTRTDYFGSSVKIHSYLELERQPHMKLPGLNAGSVYVNGFRERFIRAQARQLVRQFARLIQAREGRQLTSLELLPIDPRAVATEVLGFAVEEVDEIGFVPVGD